MEITQQKLNWFMEMLTDIESRGTHCIDKLLKKSIQSSFTEEFDNTNGVSIVFKKWIRGEYCYTSLPARCMWDDEFLEQWVTEQHTKENRRKEDLERSERAQLEMLKQKYEPKVC